ncbi:hypothetical protein [Arthrobacter tecti]
MSSSSAPHAPGSDEWWDVTDGHGHPTGQETLTGLPAASTSSLQRVFTDMMVQFFLRNDQPPRNSP